MNMGKLGTGTAAGAAGGIPWGPIGIGVGALTGFAGSLLSAGSEEKRLEEEKKQAERAAGMGTISMMKDDFVTALYRSRTGVR